MQQFISNSLGSVSMILRNQWAAICMHKTQKQFLYVTQKSIFERFRKN